MSVGNTDSFLCQDLMISVMCWDEDPLLSRPPGKDKAGHVGLAVAIEDVIVARL